MPKKMASEKAEQPSRDICDNEEKGNTVRAIAKVATSSRLPNKKTGDKKSDGSDHEAKNLDQVCEIH